MVRAVLERSRSRTGRHQELKAAFIVGGGAVKPVKLDPLRAVRIGTTYSRGEAFEMNVDLGKNDFLALVRLNRNSAGRLSGVIVLYDSSGREVLRAVIRKRKIRHSRGDPSLGILVHEIVRTMGLESIITRSQYRD